MTRRYFNHAAVRTLVYAFGTVFSKFYHAKYNDTGTEIKNLIKVPIQYLPTSGAMEHDGATESLRNFLKIFPRMTYEITGMAYDSSRQVSPFQKYQNPNRSSQIGFSPAPYTVSFSLHIVALDNLDALDIIEQILPLFRPNLNIVIKHPIFDDQNMDVLLNLDSITVEDNYADTPSTTRIVHYEIAFSMDVDLYGLVNNASINILDFIKSGGVVVEDASTGEVLDPDTIIDDDTEDDLEIFYEPSGIIRKIIVDFKRTPDGSPVLEREIITAIPEDFESQDDITDYEYTTETP